MKHQYSVERNICDCHPSNCYCSKYKIIMVNHKGDIIHPWVAEGNNYSVLNHMVELANRKKV